MVKHLSNHIQQVHKEIKKGSSGYKQILREAHYTWQSSHTVQDKPSVKDEGSFSNLTEEGSMEDDSLQDLPHVGLDEGEEDDEEHEVVMRKLKNHKENHFASCCKQRMVERKDAKIAKQHCSQLRKILAIIHPEGSLSSLFDKSLNRDTFLRDHAEKKY